MTLLKFLSAIVFIFTSSNTSYGQTTTKATLINPNNKQLVKKIFEELINKKDLATFDKYFAKDVIDHAAWPGQAPGLEGLRNAVKGLFDGYPDIHVDIEEMIAEGNSVATREQWSATEKASGKKRSGWTMHIIKFKDGLITEEWSKGWEWLGDAP